MSSSTSSRSVGSRMPVLCDCEEREKIYTSWTTTNPGRRFYGCPNYEVNRNQGCGFFDWYDNEISSRGKLIIRGLLRRIDNHQAKEKMFWIGLGFSWLIITLCIVLISCLLVKCNGDGGRGNLAIA